MAASVSSLDQDMKNLRMSRYTAQSANEARAWIEDTLGERLPGGDLLDALKDGTILCRLVNLAVPSSGIKFKKSPMPFVQMENIAHFLRACEIPPLNLHAHDRFLTVDLYEAKDPAQVIQCLGAFSRAANAANPSRIPSTIGPKRGAVISPTTTGPAKDSMTSPGAGRSRGVSTTSSHNGSSTFNPLSRHERALSPSITGGSNSSKNTEGGPRSPQGGISSWSKMGDEGLTPPAWNIHHYGHIGGASQGNQGISFGARRQITSPGPSVPNLAEKERKRREKEAEDERLRLLAEEAEYKRRVEREAEEERIRIEEEQKWEEEARRVRDEEKRRVEQQKREWEEQERQWKKEEESRLRDEREEAERMERQTLRKREKSNTRLRGQYLSEYQGEQQGVRARSRRNSHDDPERMAEQERVRELERQLEEAKERERRYLMEREERFRQDEERSQRRKARSRSRSRPRPPPRAPSPKDSEVSWVGDEREYLRQQWTDHHVPIDIPSRPLPDPTAAASPPSMPSRPLPDPTMGPPPLPAKPARPLPDPTSYNKNNSGSAPPANRTDRYLAKNPAPAPLKPATHYPAEMGLTSSSERDAENSRRLASQQKTKAGGWASKSLLEREMERERERQKEWEESQKQTRAAPRDTEEGSDPGQTWDVHQYGYVGGDSQNKGGTGIAFGGRRQIIGPRPRP